MYSTQPSIDARKYVWPAVAAPMTSLIWQKEDREMYKIVKKSFPASCSNPWPSYLSNQTGEDEDTNEKVWHLESDLKDGHRLRKTADVDQAADSVVVAAQVAVEGQDALAFYLN